MHQNVPTPAASTIILFIINESRDQILGPSDDSRGVHIREVEDQPSSDRYGLTLFQIEDRRLSVFCAQGREPRAISTVKQLHAQNISVKPAQTASCLQPEK